MDCSMPGLPVPHHFPEFAQVHVHCISNAIQPSHPLMSSSPSALNLSQHQSFPMSHLFTSDDHQNTRASASASVLPVITQIWSPLDWFDLLAAQGTLKSLLQHHNSKTSILWGSAFFTVQLSKLYMITGKTIVLTIRIFFGRVMSLLFNTLSRFVIAFLPRSNHLLISWLQSPSTMILEPKKKKSVTTSSFSLSICHALMGQDDMILVFFF